MTSRKKLLVVLVITLVVVGGGTAYYLNSDKNSANSATQQQNNNSAQKLDFPNTPNKGDKSPAVRSDKPMPVPSVETPAREGAGPSN